MYIPSLKAYVSVGVHVTDISFLMDQQTILSLIKTSNIVDWLIFPMFPLNVLGFRGKLLFLVDCHLP